MSRSGRGYSSCLSGPDSWVVELERINRDAQPGSQLEQWGVESRQRGFRQVLSLLLMSEVDGSPLLDPNYIKILETWLPKMTEPVHGTFAVSDQQLSAFAEQLPVELWTQLKPLLIPSD